MLTRQEIHIWGSVPLTRRDLLELSGPTQFHLGDHSIMYYCSSFQAILAVEVSLVIEIQAPGQRRCGGDLRSRMIFPGFGIHHSYLSEG
jgi:hypothetical protein